MALGILSTNIKSNYIQLHFLKTTIILNHDAVIYIASAVFFSLIIHFQLENPDYM